MVAFVAVLVGDRRRCSSSCPKGFIPDQDTDQIAVTTEAAQGTSYDKLVEYQDAVADIIRSESERRGARLDDRRHGGADARRPEPRADRRPSEAAQRAQRSWRARSSQNLRPQLAQVAGMQVYLQNPPTIRIGGEVSKSLYQYSMQSPDRAEALCGGAGSSRRRSRADRASKTSTSDLEITSPQVNIEIDRDKAAALGVTANAIENAFYDAYGTQVGVDDLRRRSTNTRCCSSWRRSSSAIRPRCRCCTSRRRRARAAASHRRIAGRSTAAARDRRRSASCRSTRWRTRPQVDRSADGQSLRPAAVRDDVVRAGAGRVARHRARRASARRGARDPADDGQRPLPGRRASLPEFARQPGDPARHRHPRRLHRARHSL